MICFKLRWGRACRRLQLGQHADRSTAKLEVHGDMADFGVARSCSIIKAHGIYGIDTGLIHGGASETGVNGQDHFCNCLNPPA
jgi:hypothetical protein